MATKKKKDLPVIKEADLIEFKQIKDRIARLQEKGEVIRKNILAVHEATGKDLLRCGMTVALIETVNAKYPQWKGVVEHLKGASYVQSVIDNTEPTKVKKIKIAKAS